MSLIYAGAGAGEPTIDKFYHHVSIDSRSGLSELRSRNAPGTVRYEVLIDCAVNPDTLVFAVPYASVNAVRDAADPLRSKTEERMLGTDRGATIEDDGNVYAITTIDDEQYDVTTEHHRAETYTVVAIDTSVGEFSGRIAFGIELDVGAVAVNVARSILHESTWAVDLTLYGPVNPRGHRFLDEETDIEWTVLEVEQGYSYLFLPGDAFPKSVSPTPLEAFYHGSASKFYYTWVCGRLDTWYEQRMLVIYGNYNTSIVTAILIGFLASILVTIVTTVLPLL